MGRSLNLHCPSPRMNNLLGNRIQVGLATGRDLMVDVFSMITESGILRRRLAHSGSPCGRRQTPHLTSRTGKGDRCTTPKATDPRNRLPTAPMPRVPMAI